MIYDRVRFKTTSGVTFDIELPGNKNRIKGDSGTGKSFFVKTLVKILQELKLSEKTVLERYPDILTNIIIVNLDNTSDIARVKSETNNLVIIDRANKVFEKYPDLIDYINKDTTNQYLILSREVNDGIYVDNKCLGKFKYENKYITAIYPH